MLQSILSFLAPDHPWRDRIRYFPSITSTNDVLKKLAAEGAPQGTTLVAGSQTGGRGRMGRTFLSPPETGIYMSVLLRPECSPLELMHLTCASGTAACDAIEGAIGLRPGVKWANDIVFEKRKLAGILTEMGLRADGLVSYAIIGIGINCCQQPEDFPPEIQSFAGSLAMAAGKEVDRFAVAAHMIESFADMNCRLLPEKDKIMQEYRRDCITIGQDVRVLRSEDSRQGKALDVDSDGALIVQYSDGTIQHVNSGEVSVRGLYQYA